MGYEGYAGRASLPSALQCVLSVICQDCGVPRQAKGTGCWLSGVSLHVLFPVLASVYEVLVFMRSEHWMAQTSHMLLELREFPWFSEVTRHGLGKENAMSFQWRLAQHVRSRHVP